MKSPSIHINYNRIKYNHQLYEGPIELVSLINKLKSSEHEWESDLSEFLEEWIKPDGIIELQTSGSTGQRPKTITMQKSAMVYSAQRTLKFFDLQRDDKALLCLSSRYIAGKMMVVRAMVGQLNVVAFGVDSNPLLNLNERIDFAALVPTQVKTALQESKEKFKLIKKVIIGGAAVDSNLLAQLNQVSTEFWETYGMTETVSHIALRKIEGTKVPVFTVLDGIQVTQDDRSCLVIEASNINSERLVTNDVVEFVAENQFILKGRYDNVINSGAVKLFPEQIEALLAKVFHLPFVVSSVPDNKWGEAVVVVFEAKEEPVVDINTLNVLNRFQMPKEIYCIEEFPRTETGKIKRNLIKEQLLQLQPLQGWKL